MPADGQSTALVESSAALRERAGQVVITSHGLAPRSMAELMDFGQLMAKAGPMVGKAFRESPGSCIAVTMQAMRWNMDPFAVSQKAYVTGETVAYEAQLINAVVLSNAPLARRPIYTFTGEGNRRRCKVSIWLRGEPEALEYETPEVTPTGNSPLWKKDLDQQLCYYAIRAWARRHMPELIMGVYTPDELQDAVIETRVIDSTGEYDQRPADERGEFVRGAAAQEVVAKYTARMESAADAASVDAAHTEFLREYRGRISNNLVFGMEEIALLHKERIVMERMSACDDLASLEVIGAEVERMQATAPVHDHYEACAEALSDGKAAPEPPRLPERIDPAASPFEALKTEGDKIDSPEAFAAWAEKLTQDALGKCTDAERAELRAIHTAKKSASGVGGHKGEDAGAAQEESGDAEAGGQTPPASSSPFEKLKEDGLAIIQEQGPRRRRAAYTRWLEALCIGKPQCSPMEQRELDTLEATIGKEVGA